MDHDLSDKESLLARIHQLENGMCYLIASSISTLCFCIELVFDYSLRYVKSEVGFVWSCLMLQTHKLCFCIYRVVQFVTLSGVPESSLY